MRGRSMLVAPLLPMPLEAAAGVGGTEAGDCWAGSSRVIERHRTCHARAPDVNVTSPARRAAIQFTQHERGSKPD
jgi:hypothetical protein